MPPPGAAAGFYAACRDASATAVALAQTGGVDGVVLAQGLLTNQLSDDILRPEVPTRPVPVRRP